MGEENTAAVSISETEPFDMTVLVEMLGEITEIASESQILRTVLKDDSR